MINVVLFEPEIPENTGNIMRTCAGTGAHLHLIRPLGFAMHDGIIRRSAVNYLDKVNYTLYDDFEDFCNKNTGEYYFFTRYGKKAHSDVNYTDKASNIYLILVMSVMPGYGGQLFINSIYNVNTNEFTININTTNMDINGYKLVFTLYDDTYVVGNVEKYFIVR